MITNIWIDADSCPLKVRNHVTEYAAKKNITVYFVANKKIECQSKNPFNMIVTDSSKDSADNYIFEHVTAGQDLVITKDIVFADTNQDREFTLENQLTKSISYKHYTNGYKDDLEYITATIAEGSVDQTFIKRIIKQS